MSPLRIDSFVGCLLGGALGDALGYPIEFLSAKEISTRFGDSAPRDLGYAGEPLVSDDTQMTLFSAEALVRARAAGASETTPFALGAYQRWYATQAMRSSAPPKPSAERGLLLADARLHARRAPGNTCLSALASSFTRARAATVRDPPNGSKGCGAVMRAAPFGLVARSREEAFATARDAAVLTHGHPSGFLSAAYFAALVHDLARAAPLADAMLRADDLLRREDENAELLAALDGARSVATAGPPSRAAIEALGGGWTGEEALAIALACALTADPVDVASALWRAAAHGGDSDSTASLTGNLLGASFGASALPPRWCAQVEMADLITRIARDLHRAASGETTFEARDYPPVDDVFAAR